MSLTQIQQIYEAIKNNQKPLITFKRGLNADVISSSLALALLFKKLDKQPQIVSHGFELPKNFTFLPHSKNIKQNINNLRKFIISLDIFETKIQNFHYQVENDKLNIHIEPKHGIFSDEDLSTLNTNYKHDLIIILNTPDLESLENIYENNTDFFFQTPIINIDHQAENENFGHYNLINVTATSIAEIIYDLIEAIDINLMDEQIATCLLTGMIDKTQSFKTAQVTPKSLSIASQLMTAGAKREDIVRNLYQTKTVSTLKLWGKVLQKIQTDADQKLAWSIIDQGDFKQTGTTSKDLPNITDELILNIPNIQLAALFYKTLNGQYALIKSEAGLNLLESLSEYQPQGTKELVKIKLEHNSADDLIFHLKSLIK